VDGRVVSGDVVRGEPVGCAGQHNLLVHHAVLGAVRTDLLYEGGMKGQQVKKNKTVDSVKIATFYLCFQHNKNNAK
jgi:hypothetical protein